VFTLHCYICINYVNYHCDNAMITVGVVVCRECKRTVGISTTDIVGRLAVIHLSFFLIA